MQKELIGIMSVDFDVTNQLLIRGGRGEMGAQWNSTSDIYRLQENLWFSY
jgi:hypothetical protein